MPKTLETHSALKLTRLAAKARAITTELAANPAIPDEEKSTAGKIAKGAAVAAGIGAAGYGATALIRGRNWQKRVLGKADNSIPGLIGALKSGNAANVRDIGKFAAATGAKLTSGGTAAMAQAARLRQGVTSAGASAIAKSGALRQRLTSVLTRKAAMPA